MNTYPKEELKYRAYKYSIRMVQFISSLPNENETKYWLGILRDATKIDKDVVNNLLEDTRSLANILGASLLTLKGKRNL